MATAGNITAVLTLNAIAFEKGLDSSLGAVEKFKASFSKSITPLATDLSKLEGSLRLLGSTLDEASTHVNQFDLNAKKLSQFSNYASSVNKLANALKILSSDTIDAEQGLNIINNMFKYFKDTLNGTEIKLTGITGKFTEFSNAVNKADNPLKEMQRDLMNLQQGVQPLARIKEQSMAMREEFIRSRNELMQFAQYGVNAFNQIDAQSNRVKAQMEMMNAEFERSKQELLEFARYGRSQFEQVSVGAEKVAVAEEKVANSSNKASASMERQTASTNRLNRAMSSLRMIGTMVASMMVYNFAHNLITATRETVNAKSEMQGYFQMLGFTTSQVNNFNKALDQTVAKFPRLNKYALGETISSIGVEFELTTKEMEKAMPVVSMITSEYLRAGRNVNEASLAVKDILQGEFQRLSRETGVKSDQLIEAGWSGDKKDVMGLLEALDKVGKSRNWDIFVTKANSLNDAVLILQNRFGEWSADMVSYVQPTILGVFNDLMVVANDLSRLFTGVGKWLNNDGIGQSIVKWGGLATAIGGVTTALIHYRTGANLSQLARMGLVKSIGATVLGLKGEEVAQHGLVGSLLLSNEAITENTLKEHGRRSAIVQVITGLEAETIAEQGRLKSIVASTFGVKEATFHEHGLRVALLETTAQMDVATASSMGLGKQLAVLGASIGLPLGILTAFSGAMVLHAMKVNNTVEAYKKFTEIVEQGDDIIKESKDTVDNLTARKEALTEKLEGLTEGTSEYNKVANELKVTTDDLTLANKNYEDSINAVAWSKHKQDLYDASKQEASLDAQRRINDALIDYGYNVKDAQVLSNQLWNDSINGWTQHYETLQKVNLQYSKNATTVKASLDEINGMELDEKVVTVKIRRLITTGNEIADAKEELGNAKSLTEYVDKWLWLQVKQLNHSLAQFDWNVTFKGLQDGIEGLVWGFVHFLGDNFTGALVQQAGEGSIFQGMFDGAEDLFWKWLGVAFDFQNIETTIGSLLSDFDLWGTIYQAITDFFTSSSEGSGGGDSSSTGSSVSKSINIADILRNIVDFSTEGLSQLSWEVASNFGNAVVTGILGIPASLGISDLLNAILNIDVDALGQWVDENIITPLKDAVTLGILNTPVLSGVSDFLGLGEEPQAEAETEGMEIGTSFNTGIQTGLAPVDTIINSAFEGLNLDDITANFTANTQTMTTNASTTAQNVSGSYTTMKDNQRSALDSMVSHNTTQFEAMKVKSNTSLSQMRDSTSNVTSQMTTAWSMMKDSIIASADKIKTESSNRFSTLSDRIGGFYRKIQNPSLWGSAGGTPSRRGVTNRRVGGSVARALKPNGYGGGLATRSASSTMTISRLKNELCPDGNCGNIFDGYNPNDIVNVWDFLQTIGEGHGLGGWNFASNHNQYIKTKSDEWKTAPPIIQLLSGIATNTSFKVGEFNEATPKISFSTFQDIATAIFSQIPYRLYFDSSWKGSWLGALQAGACNCYDGALALMALAQTFGFSASMGHGTWTNPDGKQTAHVWAIINGIKMDTTGMQQRGTWNPSASAGGSPTSSGSDKTVNITIDMQGATIYGVEDLDNRIEQGVRRGLREEFNDSYSVII